MARDSDPPPPVAASPATPPPATPPPVASPPAPDPATATSPAATSPAATSATPAPSAAVSEVGVRVGRHATYDRIVFDWPDPVAYSVDAGSGEARNRFPRPARTD